MIYSFAISDFEHLGKVDIKPEFLPPKRDFFVELGIECSQSNFQHYVYFYFLCSISYPMTAWGSNMTLSHGCNFMLIGVVSATPISSQFNMFMAHYDTSCNVNYIAMRMGF